MEKFGSGKKGSYGFPLTWIVLLRVMINRSRDSSLTSGRSLSGVSSLGSGGGEADAPSGLFSYGNRDCVAHLNLVSSIPCLF